MKPGPKFLQFNCVEGSKVDLRQAKAIVKYKPDIIFFEKPQGVHGPDTVFNKYPVNKKPIQKVDEIIKNLKTAAKKYPYALSDVVVWENIKKLWEQGINTQVYNIDAPSKVRKEFYLFQKPVSKGYPYVRSDWLFWVYLYVRDSFMAHNIKISLDSYHAKKNPTVLVFLQSIHWDHAQFLMGNPSKEKVWKYYFGKSKNIKPTKEIEKDIKIRSTVLNNYWKKVQKFY